MTAQDIIDMGTSQNGYHEKQSGTPTAALYPFQNAYDGTANWTKFHNDLSPFGVTQGQPWCGFFAYWCFYQLLGSYGMTEAYLYNISNYSLCGGAVSSWASAFGANSLYHQGDGYVPKPGDLVIYEDDGVPWSHVEIVTGVSQWPTYIDTIGGNTKQPWESGSEDESQWVAARTRYAAGTTGWRVKGYCEVLYDGVDDLPIFLIGQAYLRKRYSVPDEDFFEP